ncbi:MAG: hypothetical protein QF535_21860, partial [Anaerolineales bacterium]|nr:hypothetical protein [Anaerolineales bacterium]
RIVRYFIESLYMRYPLIFPEAMTCRSFCINLGHFIDGESYVDEDYIICVKPCIWEIQVKGDAYSCHIKGYEYHFERGYRSKWLVGNGIPDSFSLLIERAYEYDTLNYPKLRIRTINT